MTRRWLARPPRLSTGPTEGVLSTPGPWHKAAKYWAIFRVSLSERMTYRGDFVLGTMLRFLPMITTILLWQAIYAGSPSTQAW